ncbi:NAD(P)-binding protein [Oscillochloris sp. ZM17-4]|uniref:NAD(P)-binding protein n=1 Tax=Oscillochloris sp. ZM17-4 TaxID=2866714 RepID=UPI001C729F8A|nr:NAD(P)-binding protein [Oscillochloris sp. ZM17-4]
MSYDAIIIGAGVGGLTAAALLARDGWRVALLEGHIEPGGCASSYRRKRPDGTSYVFDVGATLFGGFQPGGAHDWVARRLGLRFPVVPLEPAMQVWLPDRAVTRYGDPGAWRAERARAFPAQAAAAERFWQNQEEIADIAWRFAARNPPMPPETAGDLLGMLPAVRPELLGLLPHLGRTVGHELRRHRLDDPALRAFVDAQLLISAQVPADEAAWLFGSVALDLARQGVFYAEGGAWSIARTLADALIRDGGELRYRAWVDQILVEGERAVGVRLAGGEELRARHIIAGQTVWDVARLLGEAAPRRLLRLAKGTPEAWGAFMLYLGVDAAAVPAGLAEHHQVLLRYGEPMGEGNTAFVSLHPADDTSRAPAGQRAVTVSTHTRVGPWWEARAAGRAAYRERKGRWAERLLDAAEVALPGLRGHIRYQQAGTPVSFARYTRRAEGMVGGLGQRPEQSGFRSLGARAAGVDRLWLVGDSAFPGQSTAAVTQGAIRLYRALRWSRRI